MTHVSASYDASWDLAFDERPARWRIGLIALATDHTTERDFARMVQSPDVAVYVSRIAFANPTSPENLRKMQPRLSEAAALILPGEPLDAIAYSCTSASVHIGDAEVAAAIARAKPDTPCVTPPAAACTALASLNACRISVLTPYSRDVSRPFAGYFADRGFEVLSLDCFGLDDDRDMARISSDSIAAAALAACDPAADALFISCTALRAVSVADRIEQELGKPVVTSNQAMAWRALRLAGCDRRLDGFGQLFRL